jgi:3-isopropylmalate dehydrogenase
MAGYKIAVMLGDDIGLEVVPQTVAVIQSAAAAAGLPLEFSDFPIGWTAYQKYGETLPEATFEGIQSCDGWILGPIGHAAYPKHDPKCINPHPILRKRFELFANIRPARSYANIPSVHKGVDLVIVRENIEGMPPDRNTVRGSAEYMPTEDVAISTRIITRQNSERLMREACLLARARRKSGRVTIVHKKSVFKLTCGLFAEACLKVAREFPELTVDECSVDTFAMKLAMRPQQYDVVVTTNIFGDIMTDLAAGLVGGLGLAPGLNVGPRHGMAQATHGSAPDIAGKNIANPYAMINSGKMLLEWLAIKHDDPKAAAAAERIARAVEQVITGGRSLTPDLGGTASTAEMGGAIALACS